jgi:hypothetical protein
MNYSQLWKTLQNYVHNFLSFMDQHPYVFIGLLVVLFLSWSRICWKLFKHAPTKAEKKKIVQWFFNGLIVLLLLSFLLLLLVIGVGQVI